MDSANDAQCQAIANASTALVKELTIASETRRTAELLRREFALGRAVRSDSAVRAEVIRRLDQALAAHSRDSTNLGKWARVLRNWQSP